MAGFGPATKQAHTQEAARHAGRNFLTCTSGVVGGQEHRACSIRGRASTSPATCGVSAIGGGPRASVPIARSCLQNRHFGYDWYGIVCMCNVCK